MKFAFAVAASIAIAGTAGSASAQTYPDRPIRMTIGFPPSVIDSSARLVAADMAKRFGQPIVVEPIISANGILAARAVVNAKPDGYTIHYGAMTGMSSIYYPPESAISADKDLAPVSNVAVTPYMLVVSSKLPVSTLKELVEYSKARPGQLNDGVTTVGGSLPAAILKKETGLDYVDVPYKSGGLVITGILSGDVAFSIASPATYAALYRNGTVRPLFITLDHRLPSMPDIPTSREVGLKELTVGINLGIWATKGTPPAIIQKLNEAAVAAVHNPDIMEKFKSDAYAIDGVGSTPEEQVEAFRAEYKFISEGIRLTGYHRS